MVDYIFLWKKRNIPDYTFFRKNGLPAKTFQEKICILDLVYRNQRKPANLDELLDKWRSIGYKDYHLYQRMALRKSDLNENYKQRDSSEKISYQVGDLNLADNILELWKTGLDERSTPLPDKMELIAKIKHGEVFVLHQIQVNCVQPFSFC